MLHLVLEVVLHLLVFAELYHIVVISLNTMLSSIVFNYIAPESILLLVLHHAHVAKFGLSETMIAFASTQL